MRSEEDEKSGGGEIKSGRGERGRGEEEEGKRVRKEEGKGTRVKESPLEPWKPETSQATNNEKHFSGPCDHSRNSGPCTSPLFFAPFCCSSLPSLFAIKGARIIEAKTA